MAGIGSAACADQRVVSASGRFRPVRPAAPGRSAGGGRLGRFDGRACAGRSGRFANRCRRRALDLERRPMLAGRFCGAGHRDVSRRAHPANPVQRLERSSPRSVGCGGHAATRSASDGHDHRLGPDHGRCCGVAGTGRASWADRSVFPPWAAAPCASPATGLGGFSRAGSEHPHTSPVDARTASALPGRHRPRHRLAGAAGHGAGTHRPLVASGDRRAASAVRAACAAVVGKPSSPFATLECRTG
ncbi:hypothetical protein D3C76_913670 [compost metagenome]